MMQQAEAPVWITDPGHAWLRVPIGDYAAAGITASSFSYIDAEYVYLEEDADATLYLDMVQAPEQSFREIHFDSEHTQGNPRKLDRIGGNVAREVTPAEILKAAQDTGRLVIIGG
tara:strand:- start:185 stop:529 length:345 start_codon:yes stop_codon:yes gene_type:complete